ncbi:hypothetical protein [Sinobaca sp. H24]|uniref:hypothetical protein n=1 Tax=Sinobaca sp. H24 TaxID=2923376 RepID=UPI00207A052C|nr:hypothetical protein [Sinobaca sp. H24]
MIDVQEKVLIRKRDNIEASLEMIERIKSVKDSERKEELDAEILMLLMNSMLFEDVQRDIFKEYYPKEVVDNIFPTDKAKQKELDRLSLQLLTIINQAVIHDYSPDSDFVQKQLEELMGNSYLKEWMTEDEKANEELYERMQPYTSLLPERMVRFLTEAFEVLLNK